MRDDIFLCHALKKSYGRAENLQPDVGRVSIAVDMSGLSAKPAPSSLHVCHRLDLYATRDLENKNGSLNASRYKSAAHDLRDINVM